MSLLETIKSLNPLKRLAPSAANRATAGLLAGQNLMEVMRDTSDAIARKAVAEALEEFAEDGPCALLITCLLEACTRGWSQLGEQLKASNRLPADRANWVCARMNDYSRSLSSELMTQHLINMVLGVTGLYVEALVLTRAQVDQHALKSKLSELLKQGLTSGLSRSDLAQTLAPAPRPSAGRLISAS